MSSLEMGECHMSELERQLAELPLVPASPQLDSRVLAELRASSDCSCTDGSDMRSHATTIAPEVNRTATRGSVFSSKEGTANGLTPGSGNGGFVSSPWLACAVCLLVGTISGRMFLPATLRTKPAVESVSVTNPETSELPGGTEHRTNSSPFSTAVVPDNAAWTLESAMRTGTKIVESSWFSPSVGAVAWEQQTGEIFRVGAHQSDRRFAMCRECHRVGG
jgi:hypothetical protein